MTQSTEVPVRTGSVVFEDLNYHVDYVVFEYRIEFVVYRMAVASNPETGEKTFYWMGDFGPTPDKSQAETEFSGHVKWDGCSNWDFHPDDKGVVPGTEDQLRFTKHFCEREQMVQFGELLGRLYDMGELIPHWSH